MNAGHLDGRRYSTAENFWSKSDEFRRFKLLGNFVNFIYTLTYVDLKAYVIALRTKLHLFYRILQVTTIACFCLLLSIFAYFLVINVKASLSSYLLNAAT